MLYQLVRASSTTTALAASRAGSAATGRGSSRSTSSTSGSWSTPRARGRRRADRRPGSTSPVVETRRAVAFFGLEGAVPSVVAEVVTRGDGVRLAVRPACTGSGRVATCAAARRSGRGRRPDRLVDEIAEWTRGAVPGRRPGAGRRRVVLLHVTDDEQFILEAVRIVVAPPARATASSSAPRSGRGSQRCGRASARRRSHRGDRQRRQHQDARSCFTAVNPCSRWPDALRAEHGSATKWPKKHRNLDLRRYPLPPQTRAARTLARVELRT